MKTTHRVALRGVAAAFAMFAAVGCNAVLGFEERTLIPPDLCEEYCTQIAAECLGSSEQYETEGACKESCFDMNSGDPGATSGDNVECRLRRITEAAQLRAEGRDTYEVCSQAGYASAIFDDPPTPDCATPCRRYCERLAAICSEQFRNAGFDDENCVGECAKIAIDPDWDPASSERDSFNTLQCRMWHLANAENETASHCNHSIGIGKCDQPLP